MKKTELKSKIKHLDLDIKAAEEFNTILESSDYYQRMVAGSSSIEETIQKSIDWLKSRRGKLNDALQKTN